MGATPAAKMKIVVVYDASTTDICRYAASGTNAGFYISAELGVRYDESRPHPS